MKPEGHYLIGIDGGTESLRAGDFDLSGIPQASASTAYPTRFPHPAWVEQDPRDWWKTLGSSVGEAVQKSSVQPEEILAMAVDTTCFSVVVLDQKGEPLRPCLIWMDMRSAPQTEKVAATEDPALRVNNNGKVPVSAEWMIPKALWIRENELDIFDDSETVCEYQDYINLHLTGRRTASINNTSCGWHYDRARGGFPKTLLEELDLSTLADKWPQEVLDLGEIVGRLTSQVSEHLGLPRDLPVVQCRTDTFIGMVGLGVVRPDSLAFITGSSHLHLGLSETPFHETGVWGTYSDALLPGMHAVEGVQT